MSNPHPAFGGFVSAQIYNEFFMPGKDPVFVPWTVLTGQTLAKGSVLGVVTASGKLKLSASAAGDGSETPRFVLAEDLDTSGGDKVFSVVAEGYINETALVFGTGHTADTVRLPLAEQGIYIKAPRYSFT